jgi:hypothetical protein
MTSSRALRVAVLLAAVLLLASCAAGPNELAGTGTDAGFFLGLWHGFIAPVTFIVSLFTDTVNVYEVANDGNWYDFGFVLGLTVSFGGAAGGGAAGTRRR